MILISSVLLLLVCLFYFTNIFTLLHGEYLENRICHGLTDCDDGLYEYLKSLYDLQPNSPDTHFYFAEYFYHCEKDYANTVRHYRISSLTSERIPKLTMCDSYIQLSRFREARLCLMDHFGRYPQDELGIFLYAMMEYKQGKLREAYESLEKAKYWDPNCRNLAYLVEVGYLIGHDDVQENCTALRECDSEELSQYPLEDFVYEICFEEDNQ